jgi:hypothetical protein
MKVFSPGVIVVISTNEVSDIMSGLPIISVLLPIIMIVFANPSATQKIVQILLKKDDPFLFGDNFLSPQIMVISTNCGSIIYVSKVL